MLLNLHVKNMMLIENVDISFTDHLNILTGETGAGKSIIIGSIALALGGRTNKDMIRKGCEYGQVELLFVIENPDTTMQLREMGIEVPDGELLISRTLYESRVVNKLNDETVTAARLRSVSEILLDMHAQNEQQSLAKKGYQMGILDRYGECDIAPLRNKVSAAYQMYRKAKEAYDGCCLSDAEQKRKMDILSYELQEIHAAMLSPGEDEVLERDYNRMKNSRELMEYIAQVYAITGYENDGSAGSQISTACGAMNRAGEIDDSLSSLNGQLADIESYISDFNREIADYIDGLQFDESSFVQIEQRLDTINSLKMKYGDSIETILEYAQAKQEEYDALLDYDAMTARLKDECERCQKQYETLAVQLSDQRIAWAKKLSEAIRQSLLDLNFLNVEFSVAVHPVQTYSASGMDEVVFMISTNVGEKMRPLAETASGGEKSRVMLAIKAVLADTDAIDTLIFDEIDVGISGRTAQKVSEKLYQIAMHHQVISITHLPQIAAMADAHYCIEKHVENDKTVTRIRHLTEDETVEELARLIGGVEITDTVIGSAKEMKLMADQIKENLAKL